MSDNNAIGDTILFDHIGQIVMSAILQGIVTGAKDQDPAKTRVEANEILKGATDEIIKHLQRRINVVRQEKLTDPFK